MILILKTNVFQVLLVCTECIFGSLFMVMLQNNKEQFIIMRYLHAQHISIFAKNNLYLQWLSSESSHLPSHYAAVLGYSHIPRTSNKVI